MHFLIKKEKNVKKTGKNHVQHYQNALKLGTISFKAFFYFFKAKEYSVRIAELNSGKYRFCRCSVRSKICRQILNISERQVWHI